MGIRWGGCSVNLEQFGTDVGAGQRSGAATIEGTPELLVTEEEGIRAILALYTVLEYVIGMAVAITRLFRCCERLNFRKFLL